MMPTNNEQQQQQSAGKKEVSVSPHNSGHGEHPKNVRTAPVGGRVEMMESFSDISEGENIF